MTVNITTQLEEREIKIRKFIEEYSKDFGLDPNLVRALITQESRFMAEATSPTGAFGFGQFTGIGARQVQNIGFMPDCPNKSGLTTFLKSDASDPNLGVKAICATLWWLFNKKYNGVADKKVQLEAVLTFYNSGGIAAGLVIKHLGHEKAVEEIKKLPSKFRSQAVKYAPEVALWYVAWHEHFKSLQEKENLNPFETKTQLIEGQGIYGALIESLKLLKVLDERVTISVTSREGLTEVNLVFPEELI